MILQLVPALVLLGIAGLLALPLAEYIAKCLTSQRTFLSPVLRPLERWIYRLSGVDEFKETDWKTYAGAFLLFNALGYLVLQALQMTQAWLPLNPRHLPNVSWHLAFNTAVSFVTNTNWQSYSGEATLSYLTQMLGLTVQNFLSASSGMAALLVLIRGFTRQSTTCVGNFWVDLTRTTVYLLLPFSLLLALILASLGVVQNFEPYRTVQTVEGRAQQIAFGPAASQVAIKELGTNGGGFFNANSSHPFENPTPASNFFESLAILFIPLALPIVFGLFLQRKKEGWALFTAMMILFLLGLGVMLWAELQPNPHLASAGVKGGVNLEGKEVRFGLGASVLWAASTTATSNGSVNFMHGSAMPLTGLVALFNMGIGEVIFGGIGVGLIGLLAYAILTMFVGGLMIGRTPELYGKKLEAFEMTLALVVIVLPPIVLLILAATAVCYPAALASLANAGPHGLSEILYAYSSAMGNNGSAFAGLNANTPFFNLTLGLMILIGRLATMLPALAIGGSLARKQKVPPSTASFPTTSWVFIALLIGVVLIVGALTYFPVYALGPVLEHLSLSTGRLF